mmetsp:Transcript_22788/g.40337  ORF Transcript_22788/g.40337 Transcript_22788/m.40337 type:complete len:215 (+) Transcript_22788:374-1018(+)
MVSSGVGSSTMTCWNLRSRAASFSMYCLYSSRVVAPMHLSSPLASIGFSRLPASIPESPALPAPTIVWISSMKRTIVPSSFTSLITALSLSSNSPRYLAPAISWPRSRAYTFLPINAEGTSPSAMRWARPSTTAVLPTPGCPMRTGLFLVLRERIWMVLRISSSRPITGSSLPSIAACVRSRAYLSSASYETSGFLDLTLDPPRISMMVDLIDW